MLVVRRLRRPRRPGQCPRGLSQPLLISRPSTAGKSQERLNEAINFGVIYHVWTIRHISGSFGKKQKPSNKRGIFLILYPTQRIQQPLVEEKSVDHLGLLMMTSPKSTIRPSRQKCCSVATSCVLSTWKAAPLQQIRVRLASMTFASSPDSQILHRHVYPRNTANMKPPSAVKEHKPLNESRKVLLVPSTSHDVLPCPNRHETAFARFTNSFTRSFQPCKATRSSKERPCSNTSVELS